MSDTMHGRDESMSIRFASFGRRRDEGKVIKISDGHIVRLTLRPDHYYNACYQ